MRQGRFFRIPETPADLERLWRDASRTDAATRPAWLEPVDSACYRYLGSVSAPGPTGAEREMFAAEVDTLHQTSFVIEADRREPSLHHVYLGAPLYPQIFSI